MQMFGSQMVSSLVSKTHFLIDCEYASWAALRLIGNCPGIDDLFDWGSSHETEAV
jgi:hypothetical protein